MQALWPQLEAVANAKGLRLSSPAASIAGGNDWYPTTTDYYKDPFNWLDDFFKACKNWCASSGAAGLVWQGPTALGWAPATLRGLQP